MKVMYWAFVPKTEFVKLTLTLVKLISIKMNICHVTLKIFFL
jgi:hypothetical protein